MFKFKLVIYLVCFFYFGNASAEQDKTPLILGVGIGMTVLGVGIIFAEQLEAHLVEIGVSAAVATLLYLVIEKEWYLGFQGLIHAVVDYWVPPEPAMRPPMLRLVPPPRPHQDAPQHQYSGKRLRDMAKLPYILQPTSEIIVGQRPF